MLAGFLVLGRFGVQVLRFTAPRGVSGIFGLRQDVPTFELVEEIPNFSSPSSPLHTPKATAEKLPAPKPISSP